MGNRSDLKTLHLELQSVFDSLNTKLKQYDPAKREQLVGELRLLSDASRELMEQKDIPKASRIIQEVKSRLQ
jgi:hypothetical protein